MLDWLFLQFGKEDCWIRVADSYVLLQLFLGAEPQMNSRTAGLGAEKRFLVTSHMIFAT